MVNRLATATSPYLLQHKDNPVDWREWGDDAFAEARARDVPVLLSVGYAACHWCHVMAHESFEDRATAEQMNRDFVCVKIDREERPDVDDVYMQATVAMTGSGGWPMTVFVTPDGRPFYAGTYFPPEPRHQMPSFRQVLAAVAEAWTARRGELLTAAERIAQTLASRRPAQADGAPPDEADLAAAVQRIALDRDQVNGGFGGAPKFPPSMVLEWLLRHAARQGRDSETGALALDLAAETLRHMAFSGMYDQVEGGFARYSVDAAWVVPHFEKMLYDNALLARVYLHWWRLTGDATARRVAEETCDWMVRRLGTSEGGFASSLDADTLVDGRAVEGATYVWTPQELTEVLGPDDGPWVAELTGVTAAGTFEKGTSTLRMLRDLDRVGDLSIAVDPAAAVGAGDELDSGQVADVADITRVADKGQTTDGVEAPRDKDRWATARARLAAARSERPQPTRDDKVVTAWNGLAIAALAETGALLSRPDLVEAARACARLLIDVHLVDDRLRRVSRDGRVGAPDGTLEDYADLAEGLLALYAVTGQAQWAEQAGSLLNAAGRRFTAGGGSFGGGSAGGSVNESGTAQDAAIETGPTEHSEATLVTDTALDAPDPVLHEVSGRRPLPADPTDNAYPSGVSALAGALLTWSALTGDAPSRQRAEALLGAVRPVAVAAPRFAGWGLAVAEALADGPREVAVVGRADNPRTAELWQEALRATAPGLVVAVGQPDAAPAVPLLAQRGDRDGEPVAYPCRGMVCDLPVAGAEALRAFTRWQDGSPPDEE